MQEYYALCRRLMTIAIIFLAAILQSIAAIASGTNNYRNNVSRIIPKSVTSQNIDIQIIHTYTQELENLYLNTDKNGYMYTTRYTWKYNGVDGFSLDKSIIARLKLDGTDHNDIYTTNYDSTCSVWVSPNGTAYCSSYNNNIFSLNYLNIDGTLTPMCSSGTTYLNSNNVLGSDMEGNLYLYGVDWVNTGGYIAYILKASTNGTLTKILTFPIEDRIIFRDSDGNYYGIHEASLAVDRTTSDIFKLTPEGTYTVLATIKRENPDYGSAEITMGVNGYIYGRAPTGGDYNLGYYFKISPAGQITRLGSLKGNITGPLKVFSDGLIYSYEEKSKAGNPLYDWIALVQIDQSDNLNYYYISPSDAGKGIRGLVQGSDNAIYGITFTNDAPPILSPAPIQGASEIFRLSLDLSPMPTVSSVTSTNPISSNNWYTGNVNVSLNVTPSTSTSKILKPSLSSKTATAPVIKYTVDNGAEQTYQSAIAVTSDGAHKITYWSDNSVRTSAKQDLSIKIDTTAPVTTAEIAGTVVSSDQYSGNASVTLKANDNTSGIAYTYYQIDSGAKQAYTNPFTVSAIEQHNITFYSVDNAGNIENTKQIAYGILAAKLHTFASGIQMISSPVDSSGYGLSQIFDSSNVKICTWNPSTLSYIISADTMHPGTGYWAKIGSTTNLMDYGLHPNALTETSIQLKKGWNLIGNPNMTNVSANSLKLTVNSLGLGFISAVYKGYLLNTIYTFQAGDTQYQKQTAMNAVFTPYVGYWLYAYTDCTLIFPVQ